MLPWTARYRMSRLFWRTGMDRFSRAYIFAIAFAAFTFVTILGAAPMFAQSAAPAAGTKELTLERLFSPPFLGGRTTQGIEWAPDGKRFSYLERKGYGKDAVIELWTMDAATGER